MKKAKRLKQKLAFCLSLVMLASTLLGTFSVYAAGELAAEQTDASEAEETVYAAMRLKFYDMAVGGDYDPNDERVQPMLESINSTAQNYWDKMNKNPVSNAISGSYRDENDQEIEGLDSSQDYIFSEYPLGRRRPSSTVYINANSLQFTFQYLRAMALAYETKGCDLYHNQEMLADIKDAVKFVYDNHFNPSIPRYGNWFSWQIGAPIYLGETLMLLYDEFTPEEIETYATAMIHYLGKTTMTGANATWTERVRMYTGILLEDPEWLDFVAERMPGMLSYTTSGDGYYTDGTFVQHNIITYNGGYGLMCLTDSAYIIYMLEGTPWELDEDSSNIVYQWVLDTYEPFVYNGLAMDAFRGREITRYDTTQPRGGLIIANAMLMLAESAPAEIAAQFKGVIKQWFSNDFMIEEMNNSADTPWHKFPLDTVVKVNEILEDDSIEPIDLSGNNYQMNAGARTIHWSEEGWTYSIAMTSKRIANCEIGDSNAKGWYTGLGMTHLYNEDLTRFEGVNKATIDWYRLPGATSIYGKSLSSQTRNNNSFTGGVTDGTYGVTGMDFATSRNNLQMKKSWFMFDDEVVALGTGIGGNGELETTLENYMIDEDNRTYSVNGESQTMAMDGEVISYEDASTLHMQGNVENSDIGFYFPNGLDLNVKSEHRTGKWSDLGEYNTDTSEVEADYFTAWTSHGENPTDASYAYVLLPGKTDAETASYAASSDVEILQQDDTAHAVYEKSLGILGVNFWQDGDNSLDACGIRNYVNSDSAASIMISENDSGMEISVSDATLENDGYINVEINRAARGILAVDDGVEVVQTAPSIQLKIDVNGSAGRSFTVKLSYDEVELQGTEILSAQMNNDALDVSLKKVPGAVSYEVVYGTESGNYTSTLETKSEDLKIYGLTPGMTYYLAARAKDAHGVSALCEEVSVTVPATTNFYDEFENFDKMLSYSSGWLFDAASPEKYNGDSTRLKRAAQTEEYITYMLPGLEDFTLEVYGYSKSIGEIELYTSADGVEWTEQAYQTLGSTPYVEWYREELSPEGAVNEGANYLKIVLKSHPAKVWAPQFTRFDATMRNSSDLKTLQDTMMNNSRTFEDSGFAFVQNTEDLYGGDGDVAAASEEGGSLLYSYTNLQTAQVTVYRTGDETVEFLAGQSGEALQSVEAAVSEEDAGDGWTRAVYEIAALPDQTDFLEIRAEGGIVISNVSLDYKPDNSPIQKIRFDDSALDGVIGYDAEPLLKTAPANGISEIEYSTTDQDVAEYEHGVLKFVGIGEAAATASVADGNSEAELPISVYENLALKKPVTVSSVTSAYPASNAVDGDMDITRWQSGSEGTEWIQVDLGPGATFDAVDIQWYSNGSDYKIMLSDDGSDWRTIQEVTEAADGGYVRFDFETPQTGRYLRVEGISEHQYSLFELRALSKDGSGISPEEVVNLALGKTATASANDPNDSSLTPEKAIDGSESTRWASGRNDDQWYIVDLGGVCQVQAVNILWEGAAGKEYKIQISDDMEIWTDMVHETNNSGAGWKEYSLPETYTGRYVRMLGISRVNTRYGFSMYEFEIMGVNLSDREPLPFTEITLDRTEVGLLKGQSIQLSAVTKPLANAASIGWKSSDPELVSVDSRGRVTVLGDAGSAVITAYSVLDESVQAECVVSVIPYAGEAVGAESVRIANAPEGVVYTGTSFDLTAVITPENASSQILFWESSNPAAASVDGNGRVTAVAPGKSVITVTHPSSGLTDSVEITVEDEPLYEITVRQTKPAAMADAVITVEPEGPVSEGTPVTVTVGAAEQGYRFLGLTAADSEGENLVLEETGEAGQYRFVMPAGPVTVTAAFETDKSAVAPLIEEAEGKLQNAYTEESWKALEEALAGAKAVLEDENAGSADVNSAVTALRAAIDALVLKQFQDVDPAAWYYGFVYDVFEKQIMTGYDPEHFGPEDTLKRSEAAMLLYRLGGSEDVEYVSIFPDVQEGAWYAEAVTWGVNNGIICGYEDSGTFQPDRELSRQELAVLMYRFAQFMEYDTGERADYSSYQDAALVQEYAAEAMSWAVGTGVVTGKYEQTVLDPHGASLRADCAAVLSRFTDEYTQNN